MRNIPKEAIQKTSDSLIVFEEKGKKITFVNKARKSYLKISVDNVAITDGTKCDCALAADGSDFEAFVELKGKDVSKAIEQLIATIERIGENCSNRHSFIVCSRVATKSQSKIQNAKVSFKVRFNSSLIIKEREIRFDLPS